jgi:hypothetical protein
MTYQQSAQCAGLHGSTTSATIKASALIINQALQREDRQEQNW